MCILSVCLVCQCFFFFFRSFAVCLTHGRVLVRDVGVISWHITWTFASVCSADLKTSVEWAGLASWDFYGYVFVSLSDDGALHLHSSSQSCWKTAASLRCSVASWYDAFTLIPPKKLLGVNKDVNPPEARRRPWMVVLNVASTHEGAGASSCATITTNFPAVSRAVRVCFPQADPYWH